MFSNLLALIKVGTFDERLPEFRDCNTAGHF